MKKFLAIFLTLSYTMTSLGQTMTALTNKEQAGLIQMEIQNEKTELNDISSKMKIIKEYIETKSLPIYIEQPVLTAISAVVVAEVVTVMAFRAKASWRAALAESGGYAPTGRQIALSLAMVAALAGPLLYSTSAYKSHYGSEVIKMTPAQINADYNRLLGRSAELILSIDKKTQEVSRLQGQ